MTSVQRGAEVLRLEAAAVVRAADRLGDAFARAVGLLASCEGRAVVSGLGKSGHVGRKISATLASLGTPSVFLHASEALHGDLGIIGPGDVVILLSNSGSTAQVVALIAPLQMRDIPIIAFTGKEDSPLGRAADAVLDTSVEREADHHDLAPTASTAVMMAMGDALAVALAAGKGFTPEDFAIFHPAGALGRRLQRVGDLLDRDAPLPAVDPATPLREALLAMTEGRLGAVVVLEDGRPAGIFTDGDVRRLVQGGMDDGAFKRPISDLMTRDPAVVSASDGAGKALRLMEEKSITAMPVVGGDGRVAGIVHLHDLVRVGIDMEEAI